MNSPCQTLPLARVLDPQCDPETESQIQAHLETCPDCQQRLSDLVAQPGDWEDVGEQLATANQLTMSPELAEKLAQSCSQIVPTSEFPREDSLTPSPAAGYDWTQVLDRPTHPEMLGRIDQFEIESRLGQGGMGMVLKGFDRELNRPVAIKVLAPHLASNGTARKRFAREAQAAAAVVHPNVVPIYAVNQSAERPYLVMQLVPGQSLQSVVDERGPLPARDVVRIGMQIADGLTAAHQQGLIHRDVKPANVLTERDVNRVMITDFGLARAVDDVGMTQTGWLAGTPHYMSPEQARGDELDPRSDLFSLGSLMYFLAAGRVPFRAERSYGVIQKIIHEEPPSVRELNDEVPEMLAVIIERLLSKSPADRFRTAEDVSHCLRNYLAHLQQPLLIPPPAELLPVRQSAPPRWRPLAVGMSAVVLSAAAAFWGWKSNVAEPAPPALEPPPKPLLSTPAWDDSEYLDAMQSAEIELQRLEQQFGFDPWNAPTPTLPPATNPMGIEPQVEGTVQEAPNRLQPAGSPQFPLPDDQQPPATFLTPHDQGKRDAP